VGGNGTAWAPNVVALAPVDDMREVYARTRVLLMPSAYESYGRTGLEAAASGIPAIAHPAAGIREALGDAAVFVGRDDFDAWEHAIRALDDEYEYARCSAAARARYDSLDPASELDALERALRALVTERRGS